MKRVEVIDLFCGVGGLSFGLLQSGICVKAGLDFDASCQYTYEKNTGAKFIHADITSYDFNNLKPYYSKNSIKLLVGCAPCQTFSTHAQKYKYNQSDDRWNLIKHFARAIEVLRPDFISLENVRGLSKTDVFCDFTKKIKSLGYSVAYKTVFCPDYGIPQNRYRLMLMGSLNGTVDIPDKTHDATQYISVKAAIGRLPTLEAGEQCQFDSMHKAKGLSDLNLERIRQSTPGGTWESWDKNLLPNCYRKETGKTYTSVYGRMSWEQPSPTITTQFFNYGSGRFGHPEQDRALSLREGAILQTFPSNYDFGTVGSLQRLGRHIGNAVPPKLGEVIGQQIMKSVEAYESV